MANVSSSNGLEKRPKLRFPGFDEPYKDTTLGEIASLVNRTDPKSDAPIMMLSAGNGFIMQSEKYSRDNAGQSLKKYILLKKGELAYNHGASKARQYGCCYELTENEARIPYVYHCFKVCETEYTPYIAIALNNTKMDKQLKRLVSSSVRMDGLLNISFEDYMSITMSLPSSDEQKYIADFLGKLDERIKAQERLVSYLKKYKRGLVFSIFSTSNPYEIAVESTPLTTLLKEYRNRETTNLRVCSVAVAKGVVDQLEHLGRRFAASDTSNYGRVKPGDVVYTKSPTGDFPYGIVKQSWLHEDVAVSPLYGVYTPLNYEVGYLIHTYFEQSSNANNHLRTLAQKGAKNTINITTGHFLDKDIPFPIREDEVSMLVGLFSRINKRIDNEESRLNKLVLQRKALMQQLFI